MFRSPVSEEISKLDPDRDDQRIVFLSTRVDFPFDTTRALELALFRTFAVPSIAALLHRTGEFESRAQKRYDDTDLIVSEIMEYGYESDRGERAIARMNALHGRFAIRNDDFLYVLSTFIFEPIRFNARFGWRRLNDVEKQAYFRFWSRVGERMRIEEIPEDLQTFERFLDDYERKHFRNTEASSLVGGATRDLFAGWFPGPAQPLVRGAIHSLLDERTREAFGFPRPSGLVRAFTLGGLRARAFALRALPRRRQPYLRTERAVRRRGAYAIEEIGPPPYGNGPSPA